MLEMSRLTRAPGASQVGDQRKKVTGRRSSKPFLRLPRDVLESEYYINLSYIAKTLLIDIGFQYRGNNNGDLTTAWRIMEKRGWKSKGTLFKAIHELEDSRFIIRTRQGGKNIPNLFAVTWESIDYCGGKLEVRPTSRASNDWKLVSLIR